MGRIFEAWFMCRICQTESSARAFPTRAELNIHKWTLHRVLGANTILDTVNTIGNGNAHGGSEARSNSPESPGSDPEPERLTAYVAELKGISFMSLAESAGISFQGINDQLQSHEDLSKNGTPSSRCCSMPAVPDSDSGISVLEEKNAPTTENRSPSANLKTSLMQNPLTTPESLLEEETEEIISGTEDDNRNSEVTTEPLIISNSLSHESHEHAHTSELEAADYDSDATIFIPELVQWQHRRRMTTIIQKSDLPDMQTELILLEDAPRIPSQSLLNHEQRPAEEKQHACTSFGSRFGFNDSHAQTQSRKRKRSASRSSSLGKRYYCDYCSKTFRRSDGLRQHIRSHTGERPYQCRFCTESFKRSDKLKHHVRRHIGEKPYHCKFCATRSIRQDTIMKHIKRLHAPEIAMALSRGTKPYTYSPEPGDKATSTTGFRGLPASPLL